jgi:hypothetical protein
MTSICECVWRISFRHPALSARCNPPWGSWAKTRCRHRGKAQRTRHGRACPCTWGRSCMLPRLCALHTDHPRDWGTTRRDVHRTVVHPRPAVARLWGRRWLWERLPARGWARLRAAGPTTRPAPEVESMPALLCWRKLRSGWRGQRAKRACTSSASLPQLVALWAHRNAVTRWGCGRPGPPRACRLRCGLGSRTLPR